MVEDLFQMLLYVTYAADVIAPIGTLCWLHRCYVHYLWHRCYCALCMAQMLLCQFHVIYCSTDVIVHYLWPRCYWAIFCCFFVVFFCLYYWAIISFSVLGCWIIYGPRCEGDCIFQYSYWVWDYSLLCTLTLWLFWPGCCLLFQLFWNSLWMFHGHSCSDVGILVMGPSNVPCIFPQMFSLTHQCTLHHSQCSHRCSYISHCSYWWFCLCL